MSKTKQKLLPIQDGYSPSAKRLLEYRLNRKAGLSEPIKALTLTNLVDRYPTVNAQSTLIAQECSSLLLTGNLPKRMVSWHGWEGPKEVLACGLVNDAVKGGLKPCLTTLSEIVDWAVIDLSLYCELLRQQVIGVLITDENRHEATENVMRDLIGHHGLNWLFFINSLSSRRVHSVNGLGPFPDCLTDFEVIRHQELTKHSSIIATNTWPTAQIRIDNSQSFTSHSCPISIEDSVDISQNNSKEPKN